MRVTRREGSHRSRPATDAEVDDGRSCEPAPVLVVVGSGESAAAVRMGAAEARRTGRPLHVLGIVAPGGGTGLQSPHGLTRAVRLARSEAGGRVPCRGHLRQGEPGTLLAAAARGAVLVVVEAEPTLRQSVGSDPPVQPTVAAALRLTIPTLVVPPRWVSAAHGVVTVGLDPMVPDDIAVRAAILRARLDRAVLRVLVVGAASQAEVDERLDRLGGDACELAVEREAGSVVEALRTAAASSDLLVVGRRVAAPVAARGVAEQVLDHPLCPVLLPAPGHVHHVARGDDLRTHLADPVTSRARSAVDRWS